ncbi:MAG: CD225/dispanin family protein [Nocardioides sp.]|uniref:CD225/dispanin family protein n=1 Tax=Nocardioides sp. TaxID=35761 RepID=UPI003EFDE5BC
MSDQYNQPPTGDDPYGANNPGQQPSYGQPSYGQPGYGAAGYGQPGYGAAPTGPKPANNLVWAILTTLFCCLPAGIVSIVYSVKVDGLWNTGQFAEAEEAAKKAKTWALVSAGVGVVVMVLYILLMVAGVMSADTTSTSSF